MSGNWNKNIMRRWLAICGTAMLIMGCSELKNPEPIKPYKPVVIVDLSPWDLDGNGIRDEVDAWIAKVDLTDRERPAAMQLAHAYQESLLIDPEDKRAVRYVIRGVNRALRCMEERFEDA